VYKELKLGLYEPKLYHKKQEKVDSQSTDSLFDIIEIPDFSIKSIKDTAIDEAEIVVISTGEEEINVTLAIELIDAGIERVICRVENLETEIRLKKLGIEVFSTLLNVVGEYGRPEVLSVMKQWNSQLTYDILLNNLSQEIEQELFYSLNNSLQKILVRILFLSNITLLTIQKLKCKREN